MARDTVELEQPLTPRVQRGADLREVIHTPEIQDLVYSFLRIGRPELRRAAVAAVRAIADAAAAVD